MKTFSPIFKSLTRLIILLFIALISSIPNGNSQSLWSDPATWGGTLPIAGEAVTIAVGEHIILDVDTPDLAGLTIDGTLEFANQDLNLTADWIMVMGLLQVGTAGSPYTHQAVITLNANDPTENVMSMGTRGIMVMGGSLEMHGNPPPVAWTKINANASAGSTALTLMESVSWQVGDEIAIAPTDYFDNNTTMSTQKATLTSASGTALGLDVGLNAFRWGQLQYATNSGMSLTPGPITVPAGAGTTPTVLDERAPIGNLSRNIVIQAPDDALWQNDGFGCHIMVMRANMGMNMCTPNMGCAHLDGIEIRRGGQDGNLGRYPFHWHLLSYENNAFTQDATGQYIRNSVINSSAHRGIVIHQTCGVEVSNNVLYDIRGHGIFFEDSPERRNIIDGNLVMHVRSPTTPLRIHEAANQGGSSGFWVSNPDNTITNNHVADCGGRGFWYAFPDMIQEIGFFGFYPSRTLFGIFDGNAANSNARDGFFLDRGESNLTGGFASQNYRSTNNESTLQAPSNTWQRFYLTNFSTWKNGTRGLWDRSGKVGTQNVVAADNTGRSFAGAGPDGIIERCLAIGTSLNHLMNGVDRRTNTTERTPTAFATYHSTFTIRDNIVIDFPLVADEMSGMFATNDYYLRPVEKGQMRNTNNLMINTHPGYREAPQSVYNYMTLAGALWDPHAIWGGTAGHWLVYDDAFHTYGQTPSVIAPGAGVGAVYTEGPYYGFNHFAMNLASRFDDNMELNVDRLDASFNTVGTWVVPEAAPNTPLDHQRHFAAHHNGHYYLDFPTRSDIYDLGITVSNMLTTSETLVLAVEYDGSYPIGQVFTTSRNNYQDEGVTNQDANIYKHIYQPVADRDAVVNSSGETYWQDTANDLVWIKIQGGIDQLWNPGDFPADSDQELYRLFHLRITNLGGVLPVELANFSADLNTKNEVNLTWTTLSEINNSHFEIERSKNGLDWHFLEKITGKGTTSESHHYQVFDEKPHSGTSYYRLKQVDLDGKTNYSPVKTIKINGKGSVRIYPNPTSDFLHFTFDKMPEILELEILNSNGQSVYIEKNANLGLGKINITHLSTGVYFLKIKMDGAVQMRRILKK